MTLCRTITPKLFLSHRLCLSGQNMSSRSLHRTTLAQPVAAKRLMNFTSNGKERRRQRQSGRVSPRQSLNPLLSLAFNKCLKMDGEPTERQRKKDLFLGKHTSARHETPPGKTRGNPLSVVCLSRDTAMQSSSHTRDESSAAVAAPSAESRRLGYSKPRFLGSCGRERSLIGQDAHLLAAIVPPEL